MENNRNPLYPVFLKLHQLRMVIIGGGEVGYEKLSFILKSSPEANITMVATWFSDEVKSLLKDGNYQVKTIIKAFEPIDLQGFDLVIAATDDRKLNEQIHQAAKNRQQLINVADTPDLCDFYLGSIVTKGPLKIAISTNGKSPTFAKRFRQMLETALPEDIDALLLKLHEFRDHLQGDFTTKVNQLNDLTAQLLEEAALAEAEDIYGQK